MAALVLLAVTPPPGAMAGPLERGSGGPAYREIQLSAAQPTGELFAGELSIRLSTRQTRDAGGVAQAPVLEVRVSGRLMLKTHGEPGLFDVPQGRVQIAEIDRSNPYPEIVFTSHTGGVQCCTAATAVTSSQDGRRWRAVDLGLFDGAGEFLQDVDADGLGEIVSTDDAFLSAFDIRARSAAPLRVATLRGFRAVDVSREARFQPLHRARLAAIELWGRERSLTSAPGYLAGWLAAKSLVGEGAEAWQRMGEFAQPAGPGSADCGSEATCQTDLATADLSESLADFLERHGYDYEDASTALANVPAGG